MDTPHTSVGHLLREWRARRRMSQLDLALEAEISQRHLSFLESGRAAPSRDMVIRLAERLDLPLRQRNRMLLAAGYAPTYPERLVEDEAFAPAMAAIGRVLAAHEPNPALAVDGCWNLIRANAAIAPFLQDIEEASLLEPPINVLKLSLHPGGLAPRIENLAEWRAHVLERLKRLAAASGNPEVADLEAELRAYPGRSNGGPVRHDYSNIAVPLRIKAAGVSLSFISTVTVFGTPLDVTVSEIAIESFFPADAQTAETLRALAAARASA
ncbi:helix-turn-helix domain-containing protein [Mesorhizobium sp. J428]|uniref:helix-turn-helix domain-containing protein n=1 Tax=Mesorhizobium sp. J428 TaxID=2898440 RepID=UPI0021509199|nr:helix-turn-helix transcriptional regulator [Mesorhizobium sp. J428]MCR5858942.1 helix-turn-helix transcriptional regulator [Mesorhizobium sp. J428]